MKKLLTIMGLLAISLNSHALEIEESGYKVSVGDTIIAYRFIPADDLRKEGKESIGLATIKAMYANGTMDLALLSPLGKTQPNVTTAMLYKQDTHLIEVVCNKDNNYKSCPDSEKLTKLANDGVQIFTDGTKLKIVPMVNYILVN